MNLKEYLYTINFVPRTEEEAWKEVASVTSSETVEKIKNMANLLGRKDWFMISKEENQKFYDLVAGDVYEILASRNYDEVTQLMKKVSFFCQGGSKILDAGCGTGIYTFWLAKKFPKAEITGIDFSQNMIEYAKKRGESFNLKNVQLYVKNFEKTEFDDGYFDRIICIDSLFDAEPDYALNEFSRLLSKRGKLLVKHNQDLRKANPIHKKLEIDEKRYLFENSGFNVKVSFVQTYQSDRWVFGYLLWEGKKVNEPKPIRIPYSTIQSMKWQGM
jgi:ubiquinone/menaquinone biosynthesis C-methylase UbiE